MKCKVLFRTRPQAEAFRAQLKEKSPAAFMSICLFRGRYTVSVSGIQDMATIDEILGPHSSRGGARILP